MSRACTPPTPTRSSSTRARGERSERARRREELESERDFLLRSLDDLELERAVGQHRRRVVRAVARRLHRTRGRDHPGTARRCRRSPDARARLVAAPRRGHRRRRGVRALVAVGRRRRPGCAPARPDGVGERRTSCRRRLGTTRAADEKLERAIARDPNDIGSRLLPGSASSRPTATSSVRSDATTRSSRIDDANAEAHAQAGRIIYLPRARRPDRRGGCARGPLSDELDRAVELDPEYADARFFRAVILANEYGDVAGAQNDLQQYLVARTERSVRRPGTPSCSPT